MFTMYVWKCLHVQSDVCLINKTMNQLKAFPLIPPTGFSSLCKIIYFREKMANKMSNSGKKRRFEKRGSIITV